MISEITLNLKNHVYAGRTDDAEDYLEHVRGNLSEADFRLVQKGYGHILSEVLDYERALAVYMDGFPIEAITLALRHRIHVQWKELATMLNTPELQREAFALFNKYQARRSEIALRIQTGDIQLAYRLMLEGGLVFEAILTAYLFPAAVDDISVPSPNIATDEDDIVELLQSQLLFLTAEYEAAIRCLQHVHQPSLKGRQHALLSRCFLEIGMSELTQHLEHHESIVSEYSVDAIRDTLVYLFPEHPNYTQTLLSIFDYLFSMADGLQQQIQTVLSELWASDFFNKYEHLNNDIITFEFTQPLPRDLLTTIQSYQAAAIKDAAAYQLSLRHDVLTVDAPGQSLRTYLEDSMGTEMNWRLFALNLIQLVTTIHERGLFVGLLTTDNLRIVEASYGHLYWTGYIEQFLLAELDNPLLVYQDSLALFHPSIVEGEEASRTTDLWNLFSLLSEVMNNASFPSTLKNTLLPYIQTMTLDEFNPSQNILNKLKTEIQNSEPPPSC